MERMIRGSTAVLALVALGACGGGGSSGNNPVITIAKAPTLDGDAQTGVVGSTLIDSLRVLVQEDGAAKAGVTVTWSASGTGAAVSPTTVQTDVAGLAATRWTISQTAGAQAAQATLAGATGSPVHFAATGQAGPFSQLSIQSGNNQQPMVGTPLQLFTVKAGDQFGNAISGQAVAWSVTSGDLSLTAASSNTNTLGLATMDGLAGATSGAGQVRALVAGVDTVDFALTVTPVPLTATVNTGGQIRYRSDRNATVNPAVDTIAVGGTVTWSGLGVGTHLVQSTGTPSFTTQTVGAASYQLTFLAAGSYTYDCSVHGPAMTGRVVVR
jgi:plastocyanin